MREWPRGRDEDGRRRLGERAAWDATNRRRTTRLGYVGGAVIQPNAQVCRRLAGASLECRLPLTPPFFSSPPPSVERSGRVPPRCPLSRPPTRDRSSPRTELPTGPTVVPRLHHPPLPSPITARKRKCERTGERAGNMTFVCGKRARLCVRARMRPDDATSRPLMAISAAGHQRVPTGPNRPGQLASVTFARARLLPVSHSFSFS